MKLKRIALFVVIALLIPSLSVFAADPGNSGNGGNNGNGGGIDNPGNGGGNGGNGGNAGDNNGNGGQSGSGGNGGGGGNSTASTSSTNNSSSSASASSNSSTKIGGSFSQSVGTSSGQQTVAIGSMFFGGITVSEDTRSQELRRNLSTFVAAYREDIISEEDTKEYAEYVIKELKKESKPRKCLHLVPCGRILSNILS